MHIYIYIYIYAYIYIYIYIYIYVTMVLNHILLVLVVGCAYYNCFRTTAVCTYIVYM